MERHRTPSLCGYDYRPLSLRIIDQRTEHDKQYSDIETRLSKRADSDERQVSGWLAGIGWLALSLHRMGRADRYPIVMLHGLNVQCHTWDPFARVLADNYHVIAMDMRGHGDSDWSRAGYRVRSMARDVHGLIDALGIGPVHRVGHSAGVRVAIAVAGEKAGRRSAASPCPTPVPPIPRAAR